MAVASHHSAKTGTKAGEIHAYGLIGVMAFENNNGSEVSYWPVMFPFLDLSRRTSHPPGPVALPPSHYQRRGPSQTIVHVRRLADTLPDPDRTLENRCL
jgi:hypothetical protein